MPEKKKFSLPVAKGAAAAASAAPTGVAAVIDQTVKSHPVVLFMKGSPSMPQCGFSARAAAILTAYGVSIHHVDVLENPAIRQGIKDYSDWPTIPQIYIQGEFVGGSDILVEMHENGELRQLISA